MPIQFAIKNTTNSAGQEPKPIALKDTDGKTYLVMPGETRIIMAEVGVAVTEAKE